ncbi:MAG: hypothetical protein E6248_02995 [Clostridium sp.]|uniref:hypothetical protein n=1 Tax=Clostridium sp. TaxID=1506 RepID=UPI002907D8F5|nr:hypothetical protein [Clostridium sp.]MDU5109387.1 hypothetical protein [Clostridium sp.]
MNNKYIELYGENFLTLKELLINLFGEIRKIEYFTYDTGLETFFLKFEDETICEVNLLSNISTIDKSSINQNYICLAFLDLDRETEDRLKKESVNGGYTLLT